MKNRLRSFIFFCACLAFFNPALAADGTPATSPGPTVNIRVGVHPEFDRLVVDWPKNVAYAIHRDDTRVTIEFGAAAHAVWPRDDLTHMKRSRSFLSATGKDGHLVLSFNINPKAAIKDFTSGTSVVIDITDKTVAEKPAEKKAAEKPAATPSEKNEPPQPASPAPVAQTAPPTSPPAAAPVPAPVATPAPNPAPAPTPPEAAKPAPTQAPAATTLPPVAAPTPAPVAPVTPTPPADISTPPATPAPAPTQEVKTETLPETPPATPPAPVKAGPFPDLNDTPQLLATLDPHTSLRAVVYQRGSYGYIVFDRKLTLDLNALTANLPAPRTTLEPLDLAKASGYRFAVPADAELRATRDKTAWQIFVTKTHPDVPVTASLVAQPDFALGARYLLPLPDAPEPVKLTDPVIGDDLIVLPLEQTQAFSVARKMADFEIFPAAQGLVIKPLNDKLIVRAVTDGVEITAEGGLRISSSVDTGAAQESSQRAKAAASGKSMFDFNGWHGKPEENFTQSRQRLQQTIVDVPEAERNRARLELARFYFSNGNGEEAAALLTYLAKLVPDLVAHADFRALNGASKILAWHPEDGLRDFDIPSLNNQPEIELWQAVALAEMRNWKEAEEKFFVTENMLSGYPEPFYTRFTILAVEAALAQNKDREAADWLDRLESGRHEASAEPSMEYLHGVLDAKAGHAQKAETAWKDVATSNDRLYRVRAEMALIDLGVSTRSLTPAQAADRLEALRFAWRGDDLELDILHRLGQFYIQAKNVKAGLNTLARGTQLYPNSPMTPTIKDEMANIFRDVFLSELGNQLSPLDSLTLYQQYRNLMPGGKDGDAVMRNLAERLVAIDLLDQASGLLEELVKNRLQGEERGRVSARLAAIRLLDHKPTLAIEGLDMANNGTYPADLQNERILLRSKAYSEMKQYDEALHLLDDNNTKEAKLLRAEINMRAQRWSDASKALLDLIGPPPSTGTALTPDQGIWLVNCAIAASMANDSGGLEKLRKEYTKGVASLPQKDTFRMLTEPDKEGEETRDLATAQAKIADVDMFRGFLDQYRKARGPEKNAAVDTGTVKP